MSDTSRRSQLGRLVAIACCLTLALTLTGRLLAAPPVALAADCVDSWQPITTFPTTLSGLDAQGGASVDGNPAWIVGLSSAQSESKRIPLIAQWTGSGWARITAPWTGFGVLNAVAATSSTNAWTVGSIGSYTRWPIAARWNGTSWTNVAVPKPTGQLGTFAALAMINPDSFWAVGAHLVNGYLRPLAMKRKTTVG